jgi:hypothetical protein
MCSIKVEGRLDYRYGTIFREVMKLKRTEICETIATIKDSKDKMLNFVYKFLHDSLPDLVHPCPYTVSYNFHQILFLQLFFLMQSYIVYNFTFPGQLMPQLFPQGEYRQILRLFLDGETESIANMTILASVTSPLKESFGKK